MPDDVATPLSDAEELDHLILQVDHLEARGIMTPTAVLHYAAALRAQLAERDAEIARLQPLLLAAICEWHKDGGYGSATGLCYPRTEKRWCVEARAALKEHDE